MPYEITIKSATWTGDKLILTLSDGRGWIWTREELEALATQEPDLDWIVAQAIREWKKGDALLSNPGTITNKRVIVGITVRNA